MIKLKIYNNEQEELSKLIKKFWIAHNDYTPTDDETINDVIAWTDKNHALYFVYNNDQIIGFVHLASRGARIDWLEDLFILPEYQGNGYATLTLNLVEDIVKKYSDSLYLEVAARNANALRLYSRNGYDCLNTITIRKDFQPEEYKTIGNEKILGHDFVVKDYIE